MKKLPRILAILTGIVVFSVYFAQFCIPGGILPHFLRGIPARIQLGPALLRFAASFSLAGGATVLVLLAAAFLFGRFYCTLLCPLGLLQDFLGFLTFRKCRAGKNHTLLRYGILAAALGMLCAGTAAAWRVLDPFSMFGAIAEQCAAPETGRILVLLDANAPPPPVYSGINLLFGLIPLLILCVLVFFGKRFYCTSLCPAGTMLGLAAKHSLFRLEFTEKCVRCGKCVSVCPAGCVNPAEGILDNERCLRCMKCTGVCPVHGIRFSLRRKEPETPPMEGRRKLLAGIALCAAGGAGLGLLQKAERPRIAANPPVLPAGAGSAERFLSRCTGCQLCVSVCPTQVLTPPGKKPMCVHLDFSKNLCSYNCKRCSDACPTGALQKMTLREKQLCRIGLAHFDPSICIAAHDGIHCGACAEHCPTTALRMVMKEGWPCPVPELHEEICIGCGNCEHPCPVRPEPAIVVHGVMIQVRTTDPEVYNAAHEPRENAAPDSGDGWLI